jgi:hypothetical protein
MYADGAGHGVEDAITTAWLDDEGPYLVLPSEGMDEESGADEPSPSEAFRVRRCESPKSP